MGGDQHKQRAIAIALLASLLLWNLPFGGVVLYPFKLLATWMHELSHGLVMMATGAGFERMELYRDTSGIAFARYGVGRPARAAIAAAGYMGTPVFGAVMLVLGQSQRAARSILAGLGLVMSLTAMVFVSGSFGIAVVAIGAGICIALAMLANERVAVVAVNFIAVQACVNALLDIRVLFRQNLVVNGKIVGASDAHNMAAMTVATPGVWAAIWLAWSFVLLYAALRLVYLRQQHHPAASGPEPPAEP
jgi:hypothetical protein